MSEIQHMDVKLNVGVNRFILIALTITSFAFSTQY